MTATNQDSSRTMRAPQWLTGFVDTLESSEPASRLADTVGPVAEKVGSGPAGDALKGRWLGHALHPLLTDMPMGCWIGAGLLDFLGGRKSRTAARRLVGLGLLFVPATAASGLADYSTVDTEATRRVGAVHGVGNTVVAMVYFASWRARRRDHHLRGILLGMVGGTLAWVTGYLGGHLSFARSVGTGERGLHDEPQTVGEVAGRTGATDMAATVGVAEAAEMLDVQPEQVMTMMSEGLLVPEAGDGEPMFTRAAVLAARNIGG